MIASTTARPTEGEEQREPPFDPAIVGELLRQLDKTVRAHQMYMHNNPTYLKALEGLQAAFKPAWAETDSLTLHVSDTQFTWEGTSVHAEPEKASDSLPWLLYKDGVREFTLLPGFEGPELTRFLDIIPRVRRAQNHEDDLISMLWEQEFAFLTYRYVDVASEPGLPLDAAAEPGRWPVTGGVPAEDPKLAVEEARSERRDGPSGTGDDEELKESPSGIVRMEDFDSTLYFLDDKEIAYLRSETTREYALDVRRVALAALLDILELQAEPGVREEAAQNIDAIALHLLAGRHFANVAYLLKELAAVLQRVPDMSDTVRDRLARLPDRLSEPAALSQLLQAMDEAETLPPQEELADLFAELRPSALGTIFARLGQSQNAKLRPLLELAAERLAQSNTAELVRLVASDDLPVAVEAVKRCGGLKTAAAVPALAKVLSSADASLRLAAVTALGEIGTPGAMQALEKALDDLERDVRVTAVRALAARTYKPALTRVTTLVKSRELRNADRTERVAIFELFGALCGDAGVTYLDELLNGKGGMFSRKEDPDIRACAAIALGKVGNERSQNALQRALGEKDVIVRSAVSRALKGGAA